MVVPSSGAPNQPKADGVKRQRHKPESSSLLDLWLQHHNNNLYPSKDEKEQLVRDTQLNYNQVSRWFANRRRKLKLRNCVSPSSSSGGMERQSSSPTESGGEVPGMSPQAPSCPGSATTWNDGFSNAGGTNGNGVMSSLEEHQRTILDTNNNNRDNIDPASVTYQHLPQDLSTHRPVPLPPPVSQSHFLGGQIPEMLKPEDLLPTPPALIPGIYPALPFSVPPFGVSSGINLGTTNGLLNPFFLSALASTGQCGPGGGNPWLDGSNGFLPSFFPHPFLGPGGISEKEKVIKEEEEARREVASFQLPEESKSAETERLLTELTEEESIAVSVLAEFALQRKQTDGILAIA